MIVGRFDDADVTLFVRPYAQYAAKRRGAQIEVVVKLPPTSTICRWVHSLLVAIMVFPRNVHQSVAVLPSTRSWELKGPMTKKH